MDKALNIAVLPGDGIGPEVINQAIGLIDIIQHYIKRPINMDIIPCGGKYYLEQDREWPDGSFEKCKSADAILLGAVGYEFKGKPVLTKPGYPYAEAQLAGYAAVIGNRINLDLYANLRPIKLYPMLQHKICNRFYDIWEPKEIDYIIVRENTEDAYGGNSIFSQDKVITSISITAISTERIVRYAFKLAKQRNKLKKVSCVDKSNIIGAHRFFRDIFTSIGKSEFPEITLDYYYVDAFCYAQFKDPSQFDVVVAPNFVGDIISDNGAATQGGLGLSASGNIGDNNGLFEPMHGSAPSLAGLNKANPIAAILALKMLLEWLSHKKQIPILNSVANLIETAVIHSIADKVLTEDLTQARNAYSTTQVGAYIRQILEELLNKASQDMTRLSI